MLRDTMIRTMPVAMIAMDALWTDRFHKLRGVRNRPPDRTWKPSQMIANAPIMPSRRESISIDRHSDWTSRGVRGWGTASAPRGMLVAWVILLIPHRGPIRGVTKGEQHQVKTEIGDRREPCGKEMVGTC